MKKIFTLVVLLTVVTPAAIRAQDAATEERINKLNGTIADLRESQEALKKLVERLAKEIEGLREQASKPTGNYASAEDLKSLAKSVEEVDRKRIKDFEGIDATLHKLQKALLTPAPAPKKGATAATSDSGEKSGADKTVADKAPGDDKAFPHVIKKGDTLEAIVQAYKEKNIKVTVDQILKANPGLVPEKMRTGQ